LPAKFRENPRKRGFLAYSCCTSGERLKAMWGAIKSDLMNFVTTVTDDTTDALNKVLGEEDKEVSV
jgi:hypothetical protein